MATKSLPTSFELPHHSARHGSIEEVTVVRDSSKITCMIFNPNHGERTLEGASDLEFSSIALLENGMWAKAVWLGLASSNDTYKARVYLPEADFKKIFEEHSRQNA